MQNGAKKHSGLVRFFKLLGPGLITGASDDDPSGIATYSQAGAQFGMSTLWTALVTFPLMAAIQEMCARIGLTTSQGLTSTLKLHYPRWVLYTMVLFSFPAIIMNIGADIEGMGAVANLIVPDVSAAWFSIGFTILLLVCIVYFPYRKIASILKYLSFVLFVYIFVPFFTSTNWVDALKATIMPGIEFSKDYLAILVGILGTTISPYLFFWQTTMEVEELEHKQKNGSKMLVVSNRMYSAMRKDINIGMLFSNVIMFFIIVTTGSVLAMGGIHKIETVEQAAQALRPLAGDAAYYLFAFGIIGTGLLAIPVLSGALSYIISEAFGWQKGLDKKFHQARGFYLIIAISLVAGLLMNYVGFGAIRALIYSAILYGLTAPVLIAIIMHICNNKTIMGDRVNGFWQNVLGITTFVLMSAAGIALLYFQING